METKECLVRLLNEYELANSWANKVLSLPLPEWALDILATCHADKVEKKIKRYLEFKKRFEGK